MKKLIPILLIALLLAGCGSPATEASLPPADVIVEQDAIADYPALIEPDAAEIAFVSRFDSETAITLSDEGISVDGSNALCVYASNDIVYYEEKTAYDSGNPYGEGSEADMHTATEAAAHTVVNITAPGTYRISGKLSQGQIRVDLGDDAYEDPDARVELILDGADITCTVAPAILFRSVYECDGEWSADTATAAVDTSNAGANLILEGENTVHGSYVAKIFKDKEGEKKLWKQDGAIYSYMSLNVYGPGALDLTAENEGLDTELHLTINGGSIAIRSGNDGINTNQDGVSVTTINAGSVHIIAGLGEEGDGIDSNGYLVINGGTVVSSANPASDAGLDSDMGSFINGGTVVALGSTMDWAESESGQVTMNLQFAQYQSGGSAIVVTQPDGTVVFAYDPREDEVLGENTRRFQGVIISCPNFTKGFAYNVYTDGIISGEENSGVYAATTVSAYESGTQMMYTGTDVTMGGPGGMGGFGGGRGKMPEGFDGKMGGRGDRDEMPEGMTPPDGQMPEGMEDFNGNPPELSEGETMPADFGGQIPGGNRGMNGMPQSGEGSTTFYMQDMVNFFSGLTPVTE